MLGHYGSLCEYKVTCTLLRINCSSVFYSALTFPLPPFPPPPPLPPPSSPSNSPEVDSEERDRRTVMVMQLSARVGPKDLEEFLKRFYTITLIHARALKKIQETSKLKMFLNISRD